jgi:fibronectin type 3 domain-containing protein
MNKYLRISFFLFLLPATTWAQKEEIKLFGEGNIREVKLLWIPSTFAPGMQGYEVRRREVNGNQKGEWKTLNASVIVPSVDPLKDLSNVDSDPENRGRLKAKLEKNIADKKLKPISSTEFIGKLQKDPEAAKGLAIGFALDYDMALLSGFGFIDRNVPPAMAYEYGLFVVGDGKASAEPLTVYKWQYGTTPDLHLDFKIIPGVLAKSRQVELKWKFNSGDFRKKEIKGFNVYRNGADGKFRLLNPEPVMVQLKGDSSEAFFYDREAEAGRNYTYSIATLSLLETEGPRVHLEYQAAMFMNENIPPPVITEVKGTTLKPAGVMVSWTFDKASESKISGFYVQRSDLPEGYKNVSKLLPATQRTYTDISGMANRSYFKYRVVAVDKKQQEYFSNENIIYQETEMPPPQPRNLRGAWKKENGRYFIDLQWDGKKAGDTLTSGYRLYANFPPSKELTYKASIPLITENNYRYEVFNLASATYKFRISAVNPYGTHSELSDTLTVYAPSQHLDNISFRTVKGDSDRVMLSWEYDKEIKDLAGFRIFRDGKLVADEKTLTARERQWTDRQVEKGVSYVYEIQAVSMYGIESRRSSPMEARLRNAVK